MTARIAGSTQRAARRDADGSSNRRWALLATSLGFAVVQLDVSVVNVAIRPIGAELGGGVSDLQWVVSAYTLAFAALILSAGALGDRVGAKRVVAAGGFVIREAHGDKPMLPLSLFGSRTFSAATTTGLLVNIAFYGLIFVLSLYFQRAQGHSPLVTGLFFAPMTAVVMAANVFSGRLARAIGAGRVIALGSLLMAVGAAALLGVARTSAYPSLLAQLVLLGFGIGLIVPAMTSVQLGSVERSRSGIASGTLNTARQTGSVVGVGLFGSLIAGDLIGGLHVALTICVGLAAVGVGLGSVIRRDA
ncbi:MAG TPA: MFS transporter [Solirubrobacteraceae bacterium]|nr:MFS transporter [Solirubrobacteraceae bacterium]